MRRLLALCILTFLGCSDTTYVGETGFHTFAMAADTPPYAEAEGSAVYLVEHVHMRKRFALKVLLSEARENPEIVARFEREAIAAAHVDHPNVVAASDFGTTEDGAFFLVLEYIEGESLRDLVERGPLPLRRVVDIALQPDAPNIRQTRFH